MAPEGLNQCLAEAFENAAWSDMTIVCSERSWRVHRLVVCGQSSFFHKACSSEFQEAKSRTITLHDDDTLVINEMLRWMYKQEYEDDFPDEAPQEDEAVQHCSDGQENTSGQRRTNDPLAFNIDMRIVADKYDIPKLARLAEEKFCCWVRTEWNTGAFATAIEVLYATSNKAVDGLRSHIVHVAAKHAKELYRQDFGVHFRRAANSVPFFASDLARVLANREQAASDYTEAHQAEMDHRKGRDQTIHALSEYRAWKRADPRLRQAARAHTATD